MQPLAQRWAKYGPKPDAAHYLIVSSLWAGGHQLMGFVHVVPGRQAG